VEELYERDRVHLSGAGYVVWADEMRAALEAMRQD